MSEHKYDDEDYRAGEFGVIGADQGDETHYDTRLPTKGAAGAYCVSEEDEDEAPRIRFSKKKLYGRETELQRLRAVFERATTGDNHRAESLFLSGYSGCGKSALVHEFVAALDNPLLLLEGKYDELQASDPFSAITNALNRWCQTLSCQRLMELREKIQPQVEESIGADDVLILTDLVPNLTPLLQGDINARQSEASFDSVSSRFSRSTNARAGNGINQTRIQYIFRCLLRSMGTKEQPLIFFLDDLQWADAPSLELLAALLGDSTLQHLVFVGAFRCNEVHEDHPLQELLKDLLDEKKQSPRVEVLELSELSRDHVGEFIGDTLGLDCHKVEPLTEAIYSKTLGNVFFTMQAMEQLVRKNALYYDTMVFVWQWNLSRDQLLGQLSDDILGMVRSKIEQALPKPLQDALVVASYIRATFAVDVLFHVLKAVQPQEGETLDKPRLTKYLDQAVLEGLLLEVGGGGGDAPELEYRFAHDRIQEACRSFVAGDSALHELRRGIGFALAELGRAAEGEEDWMMFTAAHHLNSVPLELYSQEDKTRIANLNLHTATLSTGVAGFDQAARSLEAGIRMLDEETRWSDRHYELTIELHNHLLDINFGLGNYDELRKGIDTVLANARNLKDKGLAFVHSVGIISISKERDHAKALQVGKEMLSKVGVDILSIDIDNVKPGDIKEQEKLCKAALGKGRTVQDLFDSPLMEDETILKILDRMARSAVMSGRLALNYVLSRVAIRVCAQHGISPLLPMVVVYECLYFQKVNPNFKQSYKSAVLCDEMLEKIPGVTPGVRCKVKGGAYNGGYVLQQPMYHSIEPFLECYGNGIKAGDTEWANICAMCWGFLFVACGRQITVISEAKLAMYEEECRRFQQPPSVYAIFSITRQFLMSIKGKSSDPLVFDGKAMKEGPLLAQFDPESSTYKQTLRDLSTMKLVVACVLNDLPTMEEMIVKLKDWPDFDVLICRGYLRQLWISFGCFALARAGKKSFLETGKHYMKLFQEKAKRGDPNSKVAYLCLQAECKQTKKNYDAAIKGCADLGMLHAEALMNERCGMCQLERNKVQHAESYLTRAFEIYKDWGATAKLSRMHKEHTFLVQRRGSRGRWNSV